VVPIIKYSELATLFTIVTLSGSCAYINPGDKSECIWRCCRAETLLRSCSPVLERSRQLQVFPSAWKTNINSVFKKGRKEDLGKLPASQPHLSPSESYGASHQRKRLSCSRYRLTRLSFATLYAMCTKWGIYLQGYAVESGGQGELKARLKSTCCPSLPFFCEPESRGLCYTSYWLNCTIFLLFHQRKESRSSSAL